MGRPSWWESKVLPRLDEVAELKRIGTPEIKIAEKLGIGERTFFLYKKEYPELRQALVPGPLSEEAKAELRARNQKNHERAFGRSRSFIQNRANDEERLALFDEILEHSGTSAMLEIRKKLEAMEEVMTKIAAEEIVISDEGLPF